MSVASTISRLSYLLSTPDGWSQLYRDPEDGGLWEKTYPNGAAHGGGEPALSPIERHAALEKYGRAE